MSLNEGVERFQATVLRRAKDVLQRSAEMVKESITEGSSITGAPGQPVDTGFLRGSWDLLFPSEYERLVVTNTSYAPAIEEDDRAAFDPRGEDRPKRKETDERPHAVSEVGGPHSVKLTRASWDRVVDAAVREVVPDA
jgi:hypothetical protein